MNNQENHFEDDVPLIASLGHPARRLLVARMGAYTSPLAGQLTFPLRLRHATLGQQGPKSSYLLRDVAKRRHKLATWPSHGHDRTSALRVGPGPSDGHVLAT